MLLAGDERSRTQRGNNNAYCQDNETGWIDWERLGPEEEEFFDFVRRLVWLRRARIGLRRHRFFQGVELPGCDEKDVAWLDAEAREMTEADWHDPERRSLALVLSGRAHEYHLTRAGEPEPDDTFLLVLSARAAPSTQTLPVVAEGGAWELVLDTAAGGFVDPGRVFKAGEVLALEPRSLVLLVARAGAAAAAP
jgi:glycogen operon protein